MRNNYNSERFYSSEVSNNAKEFAAKKVATPGIVKPVKTKKVITKGDSTTSTETKSTPTTSTTTTTKVTPNSKEKEVKIKRPNAFVRNFHRIKGDLLNPNSRFKGAGRILQWTGTDRMASRFIDSTHSCAESFQLDNSNRDDLVIHGFQKEVDLVERVDEGFSPMTSEYFDAKKILHDHIKRHRESNLRTIGSDSSNIDRTYSAWERFNTACDSIN